MDLPSSDADRFVAFCVQINMTNCQQGRLLNGSTSAKVFIIAVACVLTATVSCQGEIWLTEMLPGELNLFQRYHFFFFRKLPRAARRII
jgi:hypothetical protein